MLPPNSFDLLLVTAQLSIAVAGVSTLATAFQIADPDENTLVNAGRLLNMLVFGLATAALSLIPFVPSLMHLTETLAWRISAAAALTLVSTLAPQVTRRLRRMRAMDGYVPGMTMLAAPFVIAAAGSFALCLLGIPAATPSATYVLGVLCFLTVCGILFFGVIAQVIKKHGPK